MMEKKCEFPLTGVTHLKIFPSLFYIKLRYCSVLAFIQSPILKICLLHFHSEWSLYCQKITRKVGVMFNPRNIFSVKCWHCRITTKMTGQNSGWMHDVRYYEFWTKGIISTWQCYQKVLNRSTMSFQKIMAPK